MHVDCFPALRHSQAASHPREAQGPDLLLSDFSYQNLELLHGRAIVP
jgi:hypothetical protein